LLAALATCLLRSWVLPLPLNRFSLYHVGGVMVSAAVRAAAARTWSQLLRFVGPGRTGPVSLARLEQILGMIELFSNNNTNFNFHVHVSGYDTTGKIFWLPVFEDPNVVDSAPATQVLSMLYRYIESADGMMAASGSLLALKPRSAAACGGGEPLDIGHLPPTLGDELVASASQGAGGGEAGGGGRASGKLRSGRGGRGVGATGAAIGRGGATAGGAERAPNGVPSSVGTASAATTSQAASDDLARAQAAAAAVLEVDEDADDADGEVAVVGCSARPWEVGWLRWVMVLLCGVVVWLWGVAAWLWGVVVSWWAAVPRRVEAPHLLPRMAAHTLLALSMAATTSMRTTQATLAARRAPRWRESRALCDALVASLSGRKSAAGPRSGTVGSA